MLPFYWFTRLFAGDRRAKKLKLLREQREILRYGIETSAEVLSAELRNDMVGNLVLVRLMLRLQKPDNSYLYTHADSLVTLRHIPGKGERLHIKYMPGNMDAVVIL